ncbi:MAG: peptidylprolyl isomerase [Rhodobacteraceae bacterium]|uniref:peptidylprolyl isomerase n=1 Tax=Amaricoccus sp. B4 TaxID=3368557 RepID=UPI000DAC4D0F|nr:peptidylprolyl isomerase [Paracoccaceae bacterium]
MRSLLTATALAGLILSTPVYAQDQQEPAADATEAAANYDATTVLATVNGTEITLGHLILLRSRLPQQFQQIPADVLFPNLLNQMIDQTLLADTESTSQDDDPLDIRLLLENERRGSLANLAVQGIISEPLDEAAVQAAYDEQFADFEPEPEYRAAHILVDSEDKAKELLAQINDGADFAEVAKENSTDGSAAQGGELGWFGLGRMVPEFEEAVVAMKPGDVAGPVQTQFGWHLIKLEETRDSTAPTLEEVRPQIEDQIRQQQVQDAIAELRDGAEIDTPDTGVPPSALDDEGLVSGQ